MSEHDKREDLLRELEIQSILDESRDLADREKMKKTAQKYRAKPKMKDIFSNADGQPRLKNTNPLDAEEENQDSPEKKTKIFHRPDKSKKNRENGGKEAAKKADGSEIVGEKTAATMEAELMMDGNSPDAAPEQEEQPVKTNKIVTLFPEYEEGTKFSGEVIGEVEQFREERPIESIDSIDIDMDSKTFENAAESSPAEEKQPDPENTESDNINNTEKTENTENTNNTGKPEAEKTAASEEQPEKAERVVSKVPVYRPSSPANVLNVKAGRFSEVVAAEYEEYIRSKNPSVIAHVIKPEPKPVPEEEEKPKDDRPTQEKIVSAVVGFFSKDESDDDDTPKEKSKPVEDYTGDDDESSIKFELSSNIKKMFFRTLISGAIALAAVIITVIVRVIPDAIIDAVPVAPAAYAVFNLLLLGSSVALNRTAFLSGLTPLLKFKGNSDTAVSVAASAGILQTVVSFFALGDMDGFNVNYYCVIAMLAFFCNNLGKLLLLLRVRDNFLFVSAKGQKYAAKIYNNESVADKMLSGTASEKNLIVYQHKTRFPANFLKISYAPDPSEDLASKIAPITTIASLVVALLYGVVRLSFTGAFNALALLTSLSIPIATLMAVNLPVRRLCKKLIGYGSMLSGYPSIKQFCDSTALMLDANDLFPADSIELEGIKTFEDYNVDESLLCGIAVLKESQNPIANAFDSVISETGGDLPEVESVLYEDDLGLVGWINGERILVGSRQLMDKYSVETPAPEYEEQYLREGKQLTYLSRAGRLVAMLVTRYHADTELQQELQRAEANGVSFLIRTTDCNITDELIAKLYNLFYRSIKVLPTGLGNVLREAQSVTEENSRSYLITNGKASAMARAVSGCLVIKENISLAIIIQLISVIAGILIAASLSLYAGVGVMGTLEVLIYALFWGAATLIAPSIQKP